MCHQNYFKLSGTFYTGVILILYRTNIRFYVPPGGNLNFSLMTVYVISCGPSSEALHWIRVMDRAQWPHGTQQLVYSLGGGRYELGTEEK